MVHDVGGCPFVLSLPFGEAWIEIPSETRYACACDTSLPFGEAWIEILDDC